MRLPTCFGAACCLLAFSLAAMAQGQADAESAFRAGTTEWADAYNAGEPARIVALYADDGVVMPPGAPAVSGRAALQSYFEKDIASSREAGAKLTITSDATATSGNLGWQSGTYQVLGAGGENIDTGKFLAVWERRNGDWRMIQDIWNSDAPPAAQPAD